MSSNFVTTDLNWFSMIIELIADINESNNENENKLLRKLVGKNVKIWREEKLKEYLKNVITADKVCLQINNLI